MNIIKDNKTINEWNKRHFGITLSLLQVLKALYEKKANFKYLE